MENQEKKLLLSFAILICFSGCAEICGEVDAIKPLKRDFHDLLADGVGRLIEYFILLNHSECYYAKSGIKESIQRRILPVNTKFNHYDK